jgi:hypothetical protein
MSRAIGLHFLACQRGLIQNMCLLRSSRVPSAHQSYRTRISALLDVHLFGRISRRLFQVIGRTGGRLPDEVLTDV